MSELNKEEIKNKAQDFIFVNEDIETGIERVESILSEIEELNIFPEWANVKLGDYIQFHTLYGLKTGIVDKINYYIGNFEFPIQVSIEVTSGEKSYTLAGHEKSMRGYGIKKLVRKDIDYGEFGKRVVASIIGHDGKIYQQEFRNVTDVSKYQDYKGRDKIAFESDIHGTGNTYLRNSVESYSIFDEKSVSNNF